MGIFCKKINTKKNKVRVFNQAVITIIGDSPLICNGLYMKNKQQNTNTHKDTFKLPIPDPWMDFCESLYWMSTPPKNRPTQKDIDNAKFGFPAISFKAAAVDSCNNISDLTKVTTRQGFHIKQDLVKIEGKPTIREDKVRVCNREYMRYRAEFKNWKTTLPIYYNPEIISLKQILNLFNAAGFNVGIGEWRPQKGGEYGMFHIE